uniref:Reverse transcriptase domain-containing protein n=1 Tax=Daphnia galeata TaxID=27404 RepID=A0A8J2S526_9CRUS|nr:unnamed protein product [Daphnia galeata]
MSLASSKPVPLVLLACLFLVRLFLVHLMPLWHAVEKLLDTPNSSLIPSHVRFKNNKEFVTDENELAVAKAAAILNNKPEFQSDFETVSKIMVSHPVVPLFVNVSDLDNLKKELKHRNSILRGQITICTFQVKCIQINLRHSSLASATLAQVVLDLDIDIVLIQKAYALRAYHVYGSEILVRDTVATAGKITCEHISNFAACVELVTCSVPLRLVSVYIQPSALNFTTTFSPILDAVASLFVVIGSDVNAKSLLWNSRCSREKRGLELETLLDNLTLVGDQVKIVRWLFLAISSLSDHQYIFFEIAHSDFVEPMRKPNRLMVSSVANINTDIFSSKLVMSLSRLPSPTGIDSAEVIEAHISSLVSVLSSRAIAVRIRKPRRPPVKSMPWWSSELCALRSKVRSLHKAWAAKCKAWESVRNSATNGIVFRAFSDLTEAAAQAALSSSQLDYPSLISDWEFEAAAGSLNSKLAPGNDGLPTDLLLFSLPLIKPFLIAILNAVNKCLCSSQHGFRKNRSTGTAAHQLVSFIESAFSEKKVCATAFLDIKSAFDSAWHPAILTALAGRGCPTYLLKMVNSFLSKRQAYDLFRTSFPFPVKMFGYAHAIGLLVVATTHKDPVIATQYLQLACNSVGNWFSMRKLFLSAIKTVFVLFSRKAVPLNNFSVDINSVKIYPSLTATFLGLIFDANLKWANNVQSKFASAKRTMMAVREPTRRTARAQKATAAGKSPKGKALRQTAKVAGPKAKTGARQTKPTQAKRRKPSNGASTENDNTDSESGKVGQSSSNGSDEDEDDGAREGPSVQTLWYESDYGKTKPTRVKQLCGQWSES